MLCLQTWKYRVRQKDLIYDRAFISNHLISFQILSSGLCGTDLHILEGKLRVPFPMILGHEGAGIVESTGDGVTSVKPGRSLAKICTNPVNSFLTHS